MEERVRREFFAASSRVAVDEPLDALRALGGRAGSVRGGRGVDAWEENCIIGVGSSEIFCALRDITTTNRLMDVV